MIKITHLVERLVERIEESEAKWDESQKVRLVYIEKCKEAGKVLAEIRDKIKEQRPSTKNPAQTDAGEFTSFRDFIRKNGFNHDATYRYIYLYENWGLFEKMGLNDRAATYRLYRTVEILKWGKRKLKNDPNWLDRQEYALYEPKLNKDGEVQLDDDGFEKAEEQLVTEEVHSGNLDPEQENIHPIPKYRAYYLEQEAKKQQKKEESRDRIKELEQKLEDLEKEKNKEIERIKREKDSKIQQLQAQVSNLQAQLNRGQPAQTNRVITRSKSR